MDINQKRIGLINFRRQHGLSSSNTLKYLDTLSIQNVIDLCFTNVIWIISECFHSLHIDAKHGIVKKALESGYDYMVYIVISHDMDYARQYIKHDIFFEELDEYIQEMDEWNKSEGYCIRPDEFFFEFELSPTCYQYTRDIILSSFFYDRCMDIAQSGDIKTYMILHKQMMGEMTWRDLEDEEYTGRRVSISKLHREIFNCPKVPSIFKEILVEKDIIKGTHIHNMGIFRGT